MGTSSFDLEASALVSDSSNQEGFALGLLEVPSTREAFPSNYLSVPSTKVLALRFESFLGPSIPPMVLLLAFDSAFLDLAVPSDPSAKDLDLELRDPEDLTLS